MKYTASAFSSAHNNASIHVKDTQIPFGITKETNDSLPSPAELFLSAFTACVLKNVERFSIFMKFEYTRAEIEVKASWLEKPPRMDEIEYELRVFSNDSTINIDLLHRNIEKFGTIYNTVKLACKVSGEIKLIVE
jgi:uncharacterized OsmC-like protein